MTVLELESVLDIESDLELLLAEEGFYLVAEGPGVGRLTAPVPVFVIDDHIKFLFPDHHGNCASLPIIADGAITRFVVYNGSGPRYECKMTMYVHVWDSLHLCIAPRVSDSAGPGFRKL